MMVEFFLNDPSIAEKAKQILKRYANDVEVEIIILLDNSCKVEMTSDDCYAEGEWRFYKGFFIGAYFALIAPPMNGKV